eukprot:gene13005-7740_t
MPKLLTENKETVFTIAFTATLNHSEISKSFHEFLKNEKSSDNWDFIVATHVLNSHIDKNHYNQAVEQIKYIMNVFFDLKSKTLQLLSEDEKDVAKKLCYAWKNQQMTDTKNYLEQLKELLLENYKAKEFQMFLATPTAEKLIKKHKKQKKTIVPILTQRLEYTNEDFELDHITEKDLSFFELIANEKQYTETLYKNDKYALWLMTHNYFPNVSFLNNVCVARVEYNFDYSFDQTSYVIFNNILEDNAHTTYIKVLENRPKDSFIIEQHVIFTGILPHIRKSIYKMKYENDRVQMIVKPMKIESADFHKPTTMELVTKKNGIPTRVKATQEFFFICMEVFSTAPNKSKVIVNVCLDVGTKVYLVPKRVIKTTFNDTFNGFSKRLKKTSGDESIHDYREIFENETSNQDPIARLLYDLYIEKNGEKQRKKVKQKPTNQPVDDILAVANIKDSIQSEDKNSNIVEKRFNDELIKTIKHNLSNEIPDATETNEFKSNFQFKPNDQILDIEPYDIQFDESKLFSSNLSFLSYESSIGSPKESVLEEMNFKAESFYDLQSFQPISEIDDLVAFLENDQQLSGSDLELF